MRIFILQLITTSLAITEEQNVIDCSTGDCKDGLQYAISTLVNPNYPGGYGEYFGMLLRSSIMHHGNISEKVVYVFFVDLYGLEIYPDLVPLLRLFLRKDSVPKCDRILGGG